MDIFLTVLYCLIVLSILVFIHEGGHFIAARAFGVRVTEFMLGLPGPKLSFRWKETQFGVTCIPLGGYARICGMEPGNMRPYLPEVMACVWRYGKVSASDISRQINIGKKYVDDALDELVDWGSIERAYKDEPQDLYYASAINGFNRGEARDVEDINASFESEYSKQYRSLNFAKRCLVILAGIIINLLFAIIIFVVLYSVIGVDIQTGVADEIKHINLNPIQAIQYGCMYIGAVCQAVVNLFNPSTAAETVSNSTSLIGIAVVSKSAADQGIWVFMQFMAMISASLGIMNLLPILPLDGGRFLIEIIQVTIRKNVSEKVVNTISFLGMAAMIIFFVFMMNQDVQRFILGN